MREAFCKTVMEKLSELEETFDDMVDEWWNVAAEYIGKSGEEVCGRSTGIELWDDLESWWWNVEDEKAVKEKKDRLKKWQQSGLENDKAEYKSAKSTAKRVVVRVKA